MIRVMVIDRSRIFAEALAYRLGREPDLTVVSVKVPPETGHSLLASGAVDVAVCDSTLASALLGTASSSTMTRPPHVVVLADRADDSGAGALIGLGTAGWVRRDSSSSQLLAAVRGASLGETWVPPDLLTIVLGELVAHQRSSRATADRLGGLTSRELEVLELLGRGLGRAEVAARLQLSQHTVRTHVQNIFGRLDVHSTLAAVAAARGTQYASETDRTTTHPGADYV